METTYGREGINEDSLPSDDENSGAKSPREDKERMDVKNLLNNMGGGEMSESEVGPLDIEDSGEKQEDKFLRTMLGNMAQINRRASKLYPQRNQLYIQMAGIIKSLIDEATDHIGGKEGWFRKHLLGKRVHQCARAVFTGDNSLPLGWVGVPKILARELYTTIKVHAGNLMELQKLVDRFPEFPCAITVTSNNTTIKLKSIVKSNNKSLYKLHIGDTVERHLMEGDTVAVNRQPTLA